MNDLIIIVNKQMLIDKFNKVTKLEFDITDIRMMKYFLDLEIKQKKLRIFISQRVYI
jgi:hypothetical protein